MTDYKTNPDPARQWAEITGQRLPTADSQKKKPAKVKGVENRTESEYASHLKSLELAGEIRWYRYEAITLRLTTNLTYTPDYIVQFTDGHIEIHEVKGGYMWEDSKVKLKCAAVLFPCFRFVLAQKKNGTWKIKDVPSE